MKGYRFRMDAVLRIRKLQEEQARSALLRARRDAQDAQEETRRRTGILRRRLAGAAGATEAAPAWTAEQERRERLAVAVLASRAAEAAAEQLVATRLADWERAARDLATLERLEERERDAFVAEVLAAEQRTTDEQATVRAAAEDRRRLAAARAAAGGGDGGGGVDDEVRR